MIKEKVKETPYRHSTKKHRAKDFKRKGKGEEMKERDVTR